jgi:hypothetical protein
MKQGLLVPYELSRVVAKAEPRVRHFGSATVNMRPEFPESVSSHKPVQLGASLWSIVRPFLVGGAAIFACILLLNFGIGKYQETQIRKRGSRIAQLADMALSQLEADIQAVISEGQAVVQERALMSLRSFHRETVTTALQSVGRCRLLSYEVLKIAALFEAARNKIRSADRPVVSPSWILPLVPNNLYRSNTKPRV